MAPDRLPTRAEQWAEYERRQRDWQARYDAWVDGGKQGPPPPLPVRPHMLGAARTPTPEVDRGSR